MLTHIWPRVGKDSFCSQGKCCKRRNDNSLHCNTAATFLRILRTDGFFSCRKRVAGHENNWTSWNQQAFLLTSEMTISNRKTLVKKKHARTTYTVWGIHCEASWTGGLELINQSYYCYQMLDEGCCIFSDSVQSARLPSNKEFFNIWCQKSLKFDCILTRIKQTMYLCIWCISNWVGQCLKIPKLNKTFKL